MLTSIAVTPFPGKFTPIPIVGDVYETLPLIAEIGFDAVELHVRTPDDVPASVLDPILEANNLTVSAFAPGRTFTVDGLSFIDEDPSVREAVVTRMNEFSDRASAYQASLFVGFVRGKVSEDPDRKLIEIELMADTCRRCCAYARPLGVDILWEPINRYEMDDFNTVQEALDFIKLVGMPNLKLLLDTFHMNIEEPSIIDSLRISADYTPYIHMVDSNRWAPGFGHTDFNAIARTLRDTGFDGVLSAEILPLPDPVIGARQALKMYQKMIEIITDH